MEGITYAVEIHEKKGEELYGYGDYIETVGVFKTENDAWFFMQEYESSHPLKNDEAIGVYECYDTPVSE